MPGHPNVEIKPETCHMSQRKCKVSLLNAFKCKTLKKKSLLYTDTLSTDMSKWQRGEDREKRTGRRQEHWQMEVGSLMAPRESAVCRVMFGLDYQGAVCNIRTLQCLCFTNVWNKWSHRSLSNKWGTDKLAQPPQPVIMFKEPCFRGQQLSRKLISLSCCDLTNTTMNKM